MYFHWAIVFGFPMRYKYSKLAWWRLQMETYSALLATCAGNSPVTGELPAQRPVTQSFDVFFYMCLNKRLSKQWCGWWFGTPSHTLWRHYNGTLSSRKEAVHYSMVPLLPFQYNMILHTVQHNEGQNIFRSTYSQKTPSELARDIWSVCFEDLRQNGQRFNDTAQYSTLPWWFLRGSVWTKYRPVVPFTNMD